MSFHVPRQITLDDDGSHVIDDKRETLCGLTVREYGAELVSVSPLSNLEAITCDECRLQAASQLLTSQITGRN